MQDSSDDWANEAAQMSKVYRYSLVTIAAHTSRHSNDGILKQGAAEPDKIPVPFRKNKLATSGTMYVSRALHSFTTATSRPESMLATRGWVLQEDLLSPRTLHFCSQQIFWECANDLYAEGEMETARMLRPSLNDSFYKEWDWQFSKRFLAQGWYLEKPLSSQRLDKLYSRWYQIIMNYSQRRLTFPSDVFPALSGIAFVFGEILQDHDYAAGLFKGDIHRGLLWESENGAKRAEPYRAPSWSWGSILGPIKWTIGIEDFSKDTLAGGYERAVIDFILNPTSRDQLTTSSKSFDALDGAQLKIQGYWRSIESWGPDAFDLQKMKFRDEKIDAELFLDSDFDKTAGFFQGRWGFLQIAAWHKSFVMAGLTYLYALVLMPTTDECVFERVGIATFLLDFDGEDRSEAVLGNAWVWKTLTII